MQTRLSSAPSDLLRSQGHIAQRPLADSIPLKNTRDYFSHIKATGARATSDLPTHEISLHVIARFR